VLASKGVRGKLKRICFLRRQVLDLLDWCSSEQDPKHLGDLLSSMRPP
jgi:hypothetical protein